jgi:hypothetical protein
MRKFPTPENFPSRLANLMNLNTAIQTTEYTEFQRYVIPEVLTLWVNSIIFVSDTFSVYSVV